MYRQVSARPAGPAVAGDLSGWRHIRLVTVFVNDPPCALGRWRRLVRLLFGAEEEKVANAQVAEAFRRRLRDEAGFGCVIPPIPMRNTNNATVYYLFYASQNKTGEKIAKFLFKKHGRG